MFEFFYFCFSVIFVFVFFFILIFRKWGLLIRGVVFSLLIAGLFSLTGWLGLVELPASITRTERRGEGIKGCTDRKITFPLSDREMRLHFLVKEALRINDAEGFMKGLDPIFRDRLIAVLEKFVMEERVNICAVRNELYETLFLIPSTPFVIRTNEDLEPSVISEWLNRAEGFILGSNLLLSPERFSSMVPGECTVKFEIKKNMIILYLKKR